MVRGAGGARLCRVRDQRAGVVPHGLRHPRRGPATARRRERGLFQIFVDILDQLVATEAITPEARLHAEYVAWSSVHGIATLLAGGSLRDLPLAERNAAIDRVVRSVTFSVETLPS